MPPLVGRDVFLPNESTIEIKLYVRNFTINITCRCEYINIVSCLFTSVGRRGKADRRASNYFTHYDGDFTRIGTAFIVFHRSP